MIDIRRCEDRNVMFRGKLGHGVKPDGFFGIISVGEDSRNLKAMS
jgi:hypothetical protein